MLVNYVDGRSEVQFPVRSSVIQLARSCCSGQDSAIKHQEKLKYDIQLTHQFYINIERENNHLNIQVNNLDNRLKDQNYQIACLKYELEQVNRQKCNLNVELQNNQVQNVEKFQVIRSPEIQSMSKKTQKVSELTFHFADKNKLPATVCVCGVQFKTLQNLKEHIKYHSNKANFSCKICGIQKHGLNLLRHHMKIQHNVQDFPSSKGCRKCGKLFSNLEELHSHRRRVHGRMSRVESGKQNLETLKIVFSQLKPTEQVSSAC